MPAVSLCCRICATEHPLVATGTCASCFGPLDPTYDWEASPGSRQSILDRGRPAVHVALCRPAPGHGTARRTTGAGSDSARPCTPPRRGARDRRAVAEAGHGQPDAFLQGSRRCRGRAQGAGARPGHALVLLHGKPGRCGRGAGRRRRPRGCRLRPPRPRAGEARSRRRLRPEDLRRRRDVRPLLAPLRRVVVRAPLGVRQRQSAVVLRGGLEDARLRARGAARVGDP